MHQWLVQEGPNSFQLRSSVRFFGSVSCLFQSQVLNNQHTSEDTTARTRVNPCCANSGDNTVEVSGADTDLEDWFWLFSPVKALILKVIMNELTNRFHQWNQNCFRKKVANTHLASLLILMQVTIHMLKSEASKGYKQFF